MEEYLSWIRSTTWLAWWLTFIDAHKYTLNLTATKIQKTGLSAMRGLISTAGTISIKWVSTCTSTHFSESSLHIRTMVQILMTKHFGALFRYAAAVSTPHWLSVVDIHLLEQSLWCDDVDSATFSTCVGPGLPNQPTKWDASVCLTAPPNWYAVIPYQTTYACNM